MRKYQFIITMLILGSCTKDLELPLEKSDQTIVVNCLFSEDEDWNVSLTRIKAFGDQEDSFVGDATVTIIQENNDSIELQYKGNGNYQAEERPIKGVQYQLIVKDGQKTISAKSSIPATPAISSINSSTQKSIYFSNPNLSDYNVFPLNFVISGNDQPNFVRFRLYTFNTEKGYFRYSVTKQTISTLQAKKIPEDFLHELEKLIGLSMGRYQYYWIIKDIADKHNLTWNELVNIVVPALKETKVNYRNDDSFLSGIIFANTIWLNNVSRDLFNVLGEYRGSQDATLFTDYIPFQNKNNRTDYKEEYWLEVTGMSEDYYKYQKSYIKQVINQSNPFASVIEVYSNISNGVGIFSG